MSVRPILVGTGCAAIAQFLALGLAGAGHGWVTPFFYSPLLFIAYPVILVRLTEQRRRARWVEVALLAIAIAIDLRLVANALGSEATYFSQVMTDAPVFLIPWLCLWSTWQILTVRLLLRSFNNAKDG